MKQHDGCAYGVVLLPKGGLLVESLRWTRRQCTRDWADAWKARWPALRAAGYRVVPVNLVWRTGGEGAAGHAEP